MKKNIITPMRRAIRCGIAFILLICGLCQPALAEEQSLLTLLFNDGHKQSYVLASRPKVTFDSSTLYVASDDVKDEYVLADVSQFVFDKGDVTAIAAVKDGECRLTFGGCYTFDDATNRFSYDDAYSADVWGRRTYGVSGKWFENGVVKMKPTTSSAWRATPQRLCRPTG